MVLGCSTYLQPHDEHRSFFIDTKLEEVFTYYRVSREDRERFIKTPEIRNLIEILKSVNMTMRDINEYLSEGFAQEWTGGSKNVG